jgi:hypothetical protein
MPTTPNVWLLGYAGTAASSPVTIHLDLPSPSPSLPAEASQASAILDGIPYPVYPLPTKPFPVQPPPKIGTGFAPVIPLDKTTARVRHWRIARREIKGAAGGRWFARAWVGDKESDFATAKAREAEAEKDKPNEKPEKAQAGGTGGAAKSSGSTAGKKRGSKATPAPSAVPSRASSVATDTYPLPSTSTQGSAGIVKIPALTSSSGKNASKVIAPSSNVPSRASSVATDSMPISNPQAHATKAPTKMRMILAPESDGERDVEMAGPECVS